MTTAAAASRWHENTHVEGSSHRECMHNDLSGGAKVQEEEKEIKVN